ncbi:monosaccharide ABC transporter ATP-binding protein (CUT2 family) [Glaciihabitans tibetensis]|uniref:Autoinducer 2 import ATP-binding protein LsrA n=1 Tax=Glaciihabitans tibetensis TaxID=1266600 RepID=A0A2T0VAA7_9MICO|nr:sugar ABC transporter ATP-binding protein [Glaciihabitans tibetensis]PRY67122.1 monosaccharide ABC transporter ATP-binding protein (CUT2 family) [Glaciihabitans tibetensis]
MSLSNASPESPASPPSPAEGNDTTVVSLPGDSNNGFSDSAPSDTVVSLSGVSVSYGSNLVLRDVTLSFAAGRITALLGANGAGKSTLIKALSGANPRYSGTIEVGGAVVALSSPTVARGHGISAVHQKVADGIVPGLTVAENVLLDDLAGSRHPLRNRRRDLVDARAALAVLGLEWSDRVLRADAGDLRISDAQLLILARALRSRPRLLILDEPTSALTSAESDRLFEVLRALRADGLAIVYVSHRFGEIEALADSAVVLRDGVVQSHSERPFVWNGILHDMLGRATELTHQRAQSDRGATTVAEVSAVTLLAESAPVSLAIRGGEVLGILGLIGAGKTELAEILAGLAKPRAGAPAGALAGAPAGTLTLGGEPYAPRRPWDAIRAGVVLVPEDRQRQGILPGWSVMHNISLPFLRASSRLGTLRSSRESTRASEVVSALDVVTENLNTPIDDLSGGNQQKVVVGRWLSAEPRLAILDEPFRGVDIAARREIGARLTTLVRTGAAAVVLSSDVDEIVEVSDRIIVLVAGSIALDGYADELDRSTIVEAFLGETAGNASPRDGAPGETEPRDIPQHPPLVNGPRL